ncbi:Crp/Fnr family transcriptional regulator [Aquibacillus koreensis]|uniref:Crp/Fnr family transcriptional regulator n=1 Tax=Aquibacillus koreensis TaxID=279446 RepID=A0A9X3WKJ3_9BACI|nr:Crp/Fnr family transcriptional regulator [Aquibacillus koreensis]MCT2535889.1 Crp/Fnr family transcriptional regulator [Aquibacillus koreensis]MDC3420345.1 Crp/Fnr family transcriptional regulator [Aquibacillus koreensis]
MGSALLQKQRNKKSDLISNELRDLLKSIGVTKKMHKNRYLFREGTEAHEIYLIQSGIVQIGKLTAEGKELTLRICKADDIVGELTLFCDDPKYMLSSKIIEAGEVLVISKDRLEQELMYNPSLTFEFMKWTSNHMRKLQSKMRDLLLNGKKGALYSTLIRLSNSYGIMQPNGILIDIVLTNSELAKFCVATRESVNRMLSELRKLGIVSIDDKGRITIHDLQYLRREIGCENCPIEICNID